MRCSSVVPGEWKGVITKFSEHLQGNHAIIAAGAFGSIMRGRSWPYSDLDVLIILDSPDDHAAAVFCRYEGRMVHSQVLSHKSLQKALLRNNYAFLSVVANTEIWFDRQGVLHSAVAQAKKALKQMAKATLLPAYLSECVAALHTAEKYLALGQKTAAQSALVIAISCLAAVKLVQAGSLPHKDVWVTSGATELREHELYLLIVQGQGLDQIVQTAWEEVHAMLPLGSRPLVNFLREHGPSSYMQLERAPELAGLKLTERLMYELVSQGVVEEQAKHNALLQVDEILYSV